MTDTKPTPRTDAAIQWMKDKGRWLDKLPEIVSADDYRKLELELAAIKSQQTEPVAWCNEKYNALFFDQPGIRESAAYENGELTPLYTAPQSGVREVNTDTVSVPREPTKQMLDAGGNAHWEADKNGNMLRTEAAHRIYNAMLRAAQEGKK